MKLNIDILVAIIAGVVLVGIYSVSPEFVIFSGLIFSGLYSAGKLIYRGMKSSFRSDIIILLILSFGLVGFSYTQFPGFKETSTASTVEEVSLVALPCSEISQCQEKFRSAGVENVEKIEITCNKDGCFLKNKISVGGIGNE